MSPRLPTLRDGRVALVTRFVASVATVAALWRRCHSKSTSTPRILVAESTQSRDSIVSMLTIVINRCVDLCVLTVSGDLVTDGDTTVLAASLFHVADDKVVVLDLTRSTEVSAACWKRLGQVLDQLSRGQQFALVADRREISDRMDADGIERFASIHPSLAAALACIRTPSSAEVMMTNLICSSAADASDNESMSGRSRVVSFVSRSRGSRTHDVFDCAPREC